MFMTGSPSLTPARSAGLPVTAEPAAPAGRDARRHRAARGHNGAVRTLYLLRHAKSSWDVRRPRPRARPRAAREEGLEAHRVASRPRGDPARARALLSRRTRETLDRIGDTLGDPKVVLDEQLRAERRPSSSRLREVPDRFGSVMLVGHNPGIADLLALLAADEGSLPGEVPTGALATLSVPVDDWAELAPHSARLDAFVVPREL